MGGEKIDPAELPGIDGAVGAFIAHVWATNRPGARPASPAAARHQDPVAAAAILKDVLVGAST